MAKKICTVDALNILGVIFSEDNKFASHVENRIASSRRSMFRLGSSGYTYPGLTTSAKVYLWNTVGVPSITYGMECVHLNTTLLEQLNSAQAASLKSVLGFSKRSRHTRLLKALDVPKISDVTLINNLSLLHRCSQTNSVYRSLCAHLMAKYVFTGKRVNNTLVDRVLSSGHSPVTTYFNGFSRSYPSLVDQSQVSDGVIDSIRYLVHDKLFNQRDSEPHQLCTLLVKSF